MPFFQKMFSKLSQLSLTAKIAVASCLFVGVPLVAWSFYNFGPQFGFVLGPAFIISLIAYRMHLKQLALKTGEISEASRIHLATVEALATAIDARDQVGAGHVRRTQIYAVSIGRLLGVSENDIDALRTGALLHDIGKLAIPDHILSKPDRLTPAELEKTKIHAQVGASILENVGFSSPVIPTVKYHRERWDGTGYPERLKGEKIPFTARILSVADGFDTLRGARPYRPALTREKARQIIQAEAGTRFDPSIVSVLIRNLHTIEAEISAAGFGYDEVEKTAFSTEHRNYVEQIQLANREVVSLYELAREFSSTLNLQESLELFSEKIGELVPFDTCAIYLFNEPGENVTAAHVVGNNAAELTSRRLKVGTGATGFALKSRETVKNCDPDLDFAYSNAELTGHYQTMASVPLVADEQVVGAVTIYSTTMAKYGDDHIRLLETISHIASDAIGISLQHDEATTHALTDPMTGLPNARSLQIQFEKEVARASRSETTFQLLMLDLDGFKAVNDSYGHKAGDEMLREISKVIRLQLRDYDFLARYGGDEFVALIPETSSEDVTDLCNRIEEAVAAFALPVSGGRTTSVGVSLGSSSYPLHGETFDRMIVAADKAMYVRKSSRKRFTLTHNIGQKPPIEDGQNPAISSDNLIVELDERHVVSAAIN